MRKKMHSQLPIVQPYIEHEHAAELQAMSDILDKEPEITRLVYADLIRGGIAPDTGREGMTGEQVIRALIVKQINSFSYEELAFHLADSRSYRAFCRFGICDRIPTRKTIQRNIKKIRPETLEAINQLVVLRGRDEGIEGGRKVRVDCTVTETDIHDPTDSWLLWDCVRVLTRLLYEAQELSGVAFTDHRRRAKRRSMGIRNAKRKQSRVEMYKDLVKVTLKTAGYAKRASEKLEQIEGVDAMRGLAAQELARELRHYGELTGVVVSQTERRVLRGETVPAEEKIFSIFEPHTDIIVKDRRDPAYGHKLCLTVGATGLVLDCVVENGNPADSTLAVKMIERHHALYGRVPRQAAFDGGFASRGNVYSIKELGVKDVAFHKRRGLEVTEMVKSSWVYRRLRDFRAGIEGIISYLKRSFGLNRCTWKGLPSFKAYAWSSIVSANLLILARHML